MPAARLAAPSTLPEPMSRGIPNTFDRVFAHGPAEKLAGQEDAPPSIHELFTAAMRDELPLRDFAEALV